MEERKLFFKSDFKLWELCESGYGVPFRFRYYTNSPKLAWEASFDGHEYVNCKLMDDGRLCVAFDDHKLGLGLLKVERRYYLTDSDYQSDICDEVIAPAAVVCQDGVDLDGVDTYNIRLSLEGAKTLSAHVEVPPYYQKGDNGKDATINGYNAVTISGRSVTQEGNNITIGDNVVVIEHGVTPVADAFKAYYEGKNLILSYKNPSGGFYLGLVEYHSLVTAGTRLVFTGVYNNYIYIAQIDKNLGYLSSTTQIPTMTQLNGKEDSANKEKVLSPTSTTKYPTSKAVADYVKEHGGGGTGDAYTKAESDERFANKTLTGDAAVLATTDKSNIVNGVNEIYRSINTTTAHTKTIALQDIDKHKPSSTTDKTTTLVFDDSITIDTAVLTRAIELAEGQKILYPNAYSAIYVVPSVQVTEGATIIKVASADLEGCEYVANADCVVLIYDYNGIINNTYTIDTMSIKDAIAGKAEKREMRDLALKVGEIETDLNGVLTRMQNI